MRPKKKEIVNNIKCAMCGFETTTKGFASHLRSKHKMTTREYYDMYLKRPDEGICPVCKKETKYHNFTSGYNEHCSTRCSSLDKEVQAKLRQTNLNKYGVEVAFQTEQCIRSSHSKETLAKCYQTKLERYGKSLVSDNEAKKENVQKTMLRKYGVKNAYQLPHVKEKALKNSASKEARAKYKETRKANGWNRSSSEDYFESELQRLGFNYTRNKKTEKYPWKCDFYIKDLDLHIELNLFWVHGFHYYTEKDAEIISIWKSKNHPYYDAAIDIWTVRDLKKRDFVLEHNLNFAVVWNEEQLKQLISDLEFNNCTGFRDYNEMRF